MTTKFIDSFIKEHGLYNWNKISDSIYVNDYFSKRIILKDGKLIFYDDIKGTCGLKTVFNDIRGMDSELLLLMTR